ncbi:hypothetical protein [Kitasatospora sp. NBC_01302]|uniref:hypothetical protein n=1 Tax=Kitasatospora sp. NBC_01302 TaxID=2903575 RepID=UPI002E1648B3|nr:hypothetical protein OG294_13725 [Kitasatospora sp. NBC_01302]
MTLHLLHRRPRRRFAALAPDPTACHCVIRHPRTVDEFEQLRDEALLALIGGNEDLFRHLQARLVTPCCTTRLLCPCGCGRTPGQHNPNVTGELRSAA